MYRKSIAGLPVVWIVLGATTLSLAQESPDPAIVEKISPSLVKVEYTLQYDKGQAPVLKGAYERCPNCGNFHWRGGDDYVAEERPMEIGGFLIAPDRVVTADPMIHPRFVKGIAVRFGDRTVSAEIEALAQNQNAVYLKLRQPLPETKPLVFDASLKPPYLAATYQLLNGSWAIHLQALSKTVTATETNQRFAAAPSQCLIVDKTGAPIGLCMSEELPLDDTWKRSPEQWETLSVAAYTARLDALKDHGGRYLARVTLNFRSPKADVGEQDRWSSRYGNEEDNPTELNVPGILCDEKRVLILTGLKPKVTARLERITVHPLAGGEMSARFVSSLSNYGALLAELDQPMAKTAVWSTDDIRRHHHRLLLSVDLDIKGEICDVYYTHCRMNAYKQGWRGQLYPEIPFQETGFFLFDESERLVVLPIAQRKKVAVEERWDSSRPVLTAAVYLAECLRDPATHSDPGNVPLSEEEENRLAWLGVELQAMDAKLARAQKIAHLTNDGQSGALVTYVYPDSPAAAAGVALGDILLRLHVPDQPKPLEVQIEDEHGFMIEDFPWEQLNELPAEYLSQLPKPWPSVNNSFIQALTDLGFNKPFEAEFWHEGQSARKPFTVVEGPRHYDSAARYKSEEMGLSVRDLTYEVRRYFQKKPDEPGVIIAKVESGQKAAVAGLVPYEIITHVNGEPVADVKAFEKMIAGAGEIKLSVKRKMRGRVVKIKLPEKTSAPASPSAERNQTASGPAEDAPNP